jgi:mono/diheme cytochrome c family protein
MPFDGFPRWLTIASAIAMLCGGANGQRSAQAAEPAGAKVDFVKQIQPLLKTRCYECHGPEKHESGLRLDNKEAALTGGDSGTVIEPGKPDESVLLELVKGDDPDRVMPPTGETLDAKQIELLQRWIAEGAEWPEGVDGEAERSDHWSFQPLSRIKPPPTASTGAIRSPIDAFVQARLAEQGIVPAPEADRFTLIKRLYYDLIGLPPTPAAVDAFVADTSPTAYAALVDELLNSPHFGERWGRHWLDKARYADSDGYEKDRPRDHAWKYRDWVIQAINADLPFDQFTIEQIAGDLLDRPTESQLVATGFHRQTLTNTEGGVDQEEFRVEAVFDRVETIGAVWLGLTVGCARCHSHKYDPISQREYYQLFAFFNNGDEANVDLPTSPAAMAKFEAGHAQWSRRLQEMQALLDARRAELQPEFAAWLEIMSSRLAASNAGGPPWSIESVSATSEAVLTSQPDGSWLVSGARPPEDVYTVTFRVPAQDASAPLDIAQLAALRLDVLPDPSLPGDGPGRADNGNFVLSQVEVAVAAGTEPPTAVKLRMARADFTQKGFDVAQAIDPAQADKGWAIAPQLATPHWAVFELDSPVQPGTVMQTITVRLVQRYSKGNQPPHLIGRFRLTPLSSSESELQLMPEEVRTALAIAADQRNDQQRLALFDHFAVSDAKFRELKTALEVYRQTVPFKPVFPVAVIQERAKDRRPSHLLRRGNFLEPLATVSPGTLAVLPTAPRPANGELSRLDFARWVASPENPLTPRVVVNQIWSHLFGQGLVKTAADFGVRGERPSHPELLDWLAGEFLRVGWSRKRLLRTILLSHTYRQSSVHRPELVDRDPENRLLARQNRFRVEGEIVRDLYLAASGLLEPRIGGPSVFPELPSGIAELSYADNFKWGASAWNSRPDNPHGIPPEKDLYRRGMYTFFKRTAAHPNLTTFDCPDSNTTCVERRASNTPLQALQTLNNGVFVEASRALAVRALETRSDDRERIEHLFRLCVARSPMTDETGALATLLADARTAYLADAAAAQSLCGARAPAAHAPAELAAWITLARVVMNLDEFVTRE